MIWMILDLKLFENICIRMIIDLLYIMELRYMIVLIGKGRIIGLLYIMELDFLPLCFDLGIDFYGFEIDALIPHFLLILNKP